MKLEDDEIISTDDCDIFIHIMTVGKLKMRDVMLSFKVLLKIMVKREMLLNTG